MKSKLKFVSFAVAIALSLSACSSTPSRTYAKSAKAGSYFTVPYGWHKISQAQLAKREALSTSEGATDRASAVIWQEAYSPSIGENPKSVFSLRSPNSPIAFVRVRSLLPDEVNSVSYNFLRDIFVPLTTWSNSATDYSTSPLPMTGFKFLDEREYVAKSAHGVHSIFSFTGADGVGQTFDQTAVVSDDRSYMYVLLVRSTTDYYLKHQKVLSDISRSFTVRGVQ